MWIFPVGMTASTEAVMKMINRLKNWIEGLEKYWPRNSEKGEYTGPFSTYQEWHTFFLGFYAGFKDFTDWDGLPDEVVNHPQTQGDEWYPRMGYVLGAVFRVGLMLVVAYLLF